MMISSEDTFEVRKTSLANILQRQLPQAVCPENFQDGLIWK